MIRWWLPPEHRQEKKKRKPYKWGVKAFLASFEIGETRCHNGKFKWSSLRSIGSVLKRYYGVLYTFKVINGKRTITRVL